MFLDEDERDRYPDWEQATAGLIASLGASIGTDVDDPRIGLLASLTATQAHAAGGAAETQIATP